MVSIKELNRQRYKGKFGKLQYLRYIKANAENDIATNVRKIYVSGDGGFSSNEVIEKSKTIGNLISKVDEIESASVLPDVDEFESSNIEDSEIIVDSDLIGSVTDHQPVGSELALYEKPGRVLVEKRGLFGLGQSRWIEKKQRKK